MENPGSLVNDKDTISGAMGGRHILTKRQEEILEIFKANPIIRREKLSEHFGTWLPKTEYEK
ncbi:MAG: hypothetical protein K9H64_23165 [Bacteroidales bacterium]|nr:hypothetical protein [Bacteroidales bacterium]MCF8458921.1 hypothetical protein [Bacteroidales bacterium]